MCFWCDAASTQIFCGCSLLPNVPVGGRFAISAVSKISSSFFFSFEDQEQPSQCSIMHSIVYALYGTDKDRIIEKKTDKFCIWHDMLAGQIRL